MNLVLLDGVLSRGVVVKELPSGSRLVVLEVTTRDAQGEARSVPVEWFDPRLVPDWEAGTPVVVLGSVRRRFFRSGSARTESRTAVTAERVVRADDRRSVGRLHAAATKALGS